MLFCDHLLVIIDFEWNKAEQLHKTKVCGKEQETFDIETTIVNVIILMQMYTTTHTSSKQRLGE